MVCNATEIHDWGDHGGVWLGETPCVPTESPINRYIQEIATSDSLSYSDEVAEAKKALLSHGKSGFDAILSFLSSCAAGTASVTWKDGAVELVKLLSEFNGIAPEPALLKIASLKSNVSDFRRIAITAHDNILFRKKGNECPYLVKGQCLAGGQTNSCSWKNPLAFSTCNVYILNPF